MTIREAVKVWVKKIGVDNVRSRIVAGGISGNTADRLVNGTYDFEPKGANAKHIIAEMLKDGITLGDVAAS